MKKIYNDPRISVNPLCEYVLSTTASKRNSIIKQCKTPVPYITKWYNQAEEILSFYLAQIRDEPKVIYTEAHRLKVKSTDDKMEKKYATASYEALNAYLSHELNVRERLSNYKLEMAVHDSKHKFILKGVQISLRPELILRDLDGKEQLGFVKFYFCKTEPLSKDKGELMACLTKFYFEHEFGFKFTNENCIVLDVFNGQIFSAPKAFRRNISNIEASLVEIADRWDKVLV
ncbi:MAG: hypothetical protein V4520_18545 [Bacteroidota bacterium]